MVNLLKSCTFVAKNDTPKNLSDFIFGSFLAGIHAKQFEFVGDCMRFLGIGTKAFSRFIKGEWVKAARNWQVVSVGA